MEVAEDVLGHEAVVVEQRLPLLGEELPVRERQHPPLVGLPERLEVGRDEQDLPDAVVVEALGVADEVACRRVAEVRPAIAAGRVAHQVDERRDREVDDERPARSQMAANAREEALDVVARVEVEGRIERADDEVEPALHPDGAHVPLAEPHPGADVVALEKDASLEVRQHRVRLVYPGDRDPVACDRERDAAVSDPVLEHRTADPRRGRHVVLNVVDAATVVRRVIDRVFVVRARPGIELGVVSALGTLGTFAAMIALRGGHDAQLRTATSPSVLQKAFFGLDRDPLADDVVARAVEVDLTGRDLAQRRDSRLVLGVNERRGPLHELTGAVRGKNHEGKTVFLALEAVFNGYARHGSGCSADDRGRAT